MQPSLKNSAIDGLLWNSLEKLSVQAVQFGIGIILARLLLPADFGIIGMLTIFISISQLFVDSGFSRALIQKVNSSDSDFSTVFYFNLIIGLFFYLILYIFSPLIAAFFKTPELIEITKVLALVIVINSFSIIQTAKFQIELNFKSIAKVNFISVVLSGIIGISLAYLNFGVWSLVVQTVFKSIIVAVLFWIISSWRPKWVFSYVSFQSLFKFGSKLLGAGIISTFFQNIYTLAIGRAFNANDLGYYTRGVQFAELTSGTISGIVQNVSFPVLSSLQGNKEMLVHSYRKMLKLTAFITVPLMSLIALLAEPLIVFLLTDKWAPATPLLQWLCFSRMFTPISSLNMSILNAIGRSDLFLKIDVIKIPIMILALLITIPYGVKAVVIGSFCTSLICYFINTYYPGKMFNYGAIEQTKDLFKVLFATIFSILFTFFIIKFLNTNFLKILLGGIVGVLSYFLISFILKVEELTQILIIVKDKMKFSNN